MKNPKLRGIGTVYCYTVQQHYKTRSVIIFLIVLFAITVAALPLIALMSGSRKNVTETRITQLYLRNETDFRIDEQDIVGNRLYADLDVILTEEDDSALTERIEAGMTAVYSVVSEDAETKRFSIKTNYPKNGNVEFSDAATLNVALSEALHRALLRKLSVSEAQEAMLHCKAHSQVSKISDFLRGTEEASAETHMYANIIYCVFIMMLSGLSMSYIFQLCMEEKVSKLVESLLVSIQPMALLAGKILAATTFICVGLGLCGCGLTISYQLTKHMMNPAVLLALLARVTSVDFSALHFTPETIILFVICLLLAYSISASFSGIVGSCCSRAEDTQQAALAVTVFLMLGYFAGAFAPMFENDAANIFCSLFPLTSIFSAFPNYICGKIGLPVFITGLLFQLASALLLAALAGTVYKIMLLYRGSYPKPKQLMRMLKEDRASGKEAHHGK